MNHSFCFRQIILSASSSVCLFACCMWAPSGPICICNVCFFPELFERVVCNASVNAGCPISKIAVCALLFRQAKKKQESSMATNKQSKQESSMAEKSWRKLYQVQMVKYERSLVHLAEDKQHLIVNKLFILPQVATHMLFQLISDLQK